MKDVNLEIAGTIPAHSNAIGCVFPQVTFEPRVIVLPNQPLVFFFHLGRAIACRGQNITLEPGLGLSHTILLGEFWACLVTNSDDEDKALRLLVKGHTNDASMPSTFAVGSGGFYVPTARLPVGAGAT